MLPKVSDFKLAAATLRQACQAAGTPFVDVSVCFAKTPTTGALHIGPSDSFGYTLYKIVSEYVEQPYLLAKPLFQDDKQKRFFVIHHAAIVRKLLDFPKLSSVSSQNLIAGRLYSMPLVWAAMKDLVCPLHSIEPRNVLLVSGSAPALDAARYCGDAESSASKDPFIFCNESVRNPVAKNVFILLAAIEAHNMSPKAVFEKLVGGALADKFLGLSRLAFIDDEDADEFISLLMKCLNYRSSDFPHLSASSSKAVKEAQMGSQSNPQWWYLGLPEKMLEPVRGSDWSVHENLQPWVDDFWEEVRRIESKKNQGEGIPMDLLLRLKDSDTPHGDATVTLQELLKEQRIWN